MDRYMNAFKEFKKKFQNGNNIDDKVVTQNLEEDKNKKHIFVNEKVSLMDECTRSDELNLFHTEALVAVL